MINTSQSDFIHNRISILLIENDEISALVAKDMFEQLNCGVDHVKTGEDAMLKYKSNYYNLILMDIGLPSSMDGLKTTKKIRLYEMGVKMSLYIPIIGLSGIHKPYIKAKCLEAGMDNFIAKPLTAEIAIQIIQKFIKKTDQINETDNGINKFASVSGNTLNLQTFYNLIEKSKEQEKMRDAIDISVGCFPEKIQELKLMYHQGDWKRIHEITVQLSGQSSYYGMDRLKQACIQLMENIDSNHVDYIEAMFYELMHEIDLAYKEYSLAKGKGVI